MTETRIEIIVSGDNAAATMDRLTSQLPDDAVVTAATDVVPSTVELFASGLQASGGLSSKVSEWFTALAASDGLQPAAILGLCAVILVGAYISERLLAGAFLGRRASTENAQSLEAARLGAALWWGFTQIGRLVFFYVVSLIGINTFFGAGSEAQELAQVVLTSVMLPRTWFVILELLSAAGDPTRRPNSLTDKEAGKVMTAALCLVIIIGVTAFARDFVFGVVDADASGSIFAVLTRLLDGVVASVFFIIIRQPVGKLITGALSTDPENPEPIVRNFSRFWPVLYIVLFILQVGAEARGYLSGTLGEDASALKRSFAVFVLAPFIVAGLGILRDDLLSRAEDSKQGRISGIFSLLDGAVIVGAAIIILYAWNIDPFATDLTGAKRILPGLVSAAIVTVIGISAWRTASGFLKLNTPEGDSGGNAVPDGEGGVGGSRIETVFPILRVALGSLIAVVTVLLALSSLGVQIAPLLAGAGILGLAVGFGAQKIVEDIISGVLYLVEDAFRKGEYIETSEGKGEVESIMLRSVRLRHHNGPVITIPFSSMGTIKNHSRDWVTVKLSFEVSHDEDLEKVRKLIKKVGAQLLEDPELEGKFLAPLKSQGAVAMVGSNYKIGVKFTSRPGEQFLMRRKALTSIQKAFSENKVKMAAPRVIVDTRQDIEAAAAKFISDGAESA